MNFMNQPPTWDGRRRVANKIIEMGDVKCGSLVPVNSLNRLSYISSEIGVTQSCIRVFPAVPTSASDGDVVLCKDDFFGDWEHLDVYSGSCGGEASGRHECSGEVWNYVKKVVVDDINDDFCAKWGFSNADDAKRTVFSNHATGYYSFATEMPAPYNGLCADACFHPDDMYGADKTVPCFFDDTKVSLRVIQEVLTSRASDFTGGYHGTYNDDDDVDNDYDDDYDSDSDSSSYTINENSSSSEEYA